MNTEVVAVLRQAQDAINVVSKEMLDPAINPQSAAYQALFDTRHSLQDLVNELLNDDLTARVDDLTKQEEGLSDLVKQMQAADTKLTAVSKTVDSVAKAVGILAQIIALAAKIL